MEMIGQGWPLYAAGVTGRRKGKVYAVVGWVDHTADAPNLGGVPVLVELDGGSLAERYQVEKGIARLFTSERDARYAAGHPVPYSADGAPVEPWTLDTPSGAQCAWVDDRNQEHFVPADSAVAGWRRLYVGPVTR